MRRCLVWRWSPAGFSASGPWLDRSRRMSTRLTIQTLGIEFSLTVFFAQDSAFNRNFLGPLRMARPPSYRNHRL